MAGSTRGHYHGEISAHCLVEVAPLGPGRPTIVARIALATVFGAIPGGWDQRLLLGDNNLREKKAAEGGDEGSRRHMELRNRLELEQSPEQ